MKNGRYCFGFCANQSETLQEEDLGRGPLSIYS